MIPDALDLQNKTRPICLMKDMSNSGYGIGVLLGSCSSFSLFLLPYPIDNIFLCCPYVFDCSILG